MDGLAIYIHWPYCARICPYCDFNVYKDREDNTLCGRIIDDLTLWREWSGERQITSIHFGGGTPSLMLPKDIEKILQSIKTLWGSLGGAEVALEANPHDAHAARWQSYADKGINRLSLGVQSFHDPALKLLGRDHNADEAKAALGLAMDIFPSVSLDLIFGWTGQSERLLEQDINLALGSGAQHISAYQLTIEEGTAFAKAEARGDIKAVGADESADFYDYVSDLLRAEGFEHYEVSNYAKSGHRSHHNLNYWRGGDYVGVGPGAHGRLTHQGKRYATIASLRPNDYKRNFLEEKIELTPTEWAEEYVLMGLRIEEGISLSRFEDIGGKPINGIALEKLLTANLIHQDGDRLWASETGRLVLNTVTDKLLLT